MDEIYEKYFQKSMTFLYPLLRIKKNSAYTPYASYLRRNGNTKEQYKLYVLYNSNPVKKDDKEKFNNFYKNELINHDMLEEIDILTEQNIMIAKFDLSSVKNEVKLFYKGFYSKLSTKSKREILTYYGVTSPQYPHIDSFLHPEKFHKTYADCLDVDVSILINNHELASRPDPNKENLTKGKILVYAKRINDDLRSGALRSTTKQSQDI